MKKLAGKWFDGFDVRLPFFSIKFKKPSKSTSITITKGSSKGNNLV